MKTQHKITVPLGSAQIAVVDFEHDTVADTYTVVFAGALLRSGDHDTLANVLAAIPVYERGVA